MQDIKNKTALITGGSKGIGLGIAKSLKDEGVKVAITSRSQQTVDKAVSELESIDAGEVLGIVADVRSMESQEAAVKKVIEAWGSLDVLIANAGLGHFASIEDLTADQWNETIDTNLTGVFYSIKSGLDALKKITGLFYYHFEPGRY